LKPKAVSLSNTYRALRFVGDATYGDLLYAEFTSQADWHYDTPVHYELFNMTEGENKNASFLRLRHFVGSMKNLRLPRQARDKHNSN
jgi:hypothetical protein